MPGEYSSQRVHLIMQPCKLFWTVFQWVFTWAVNGNRFALCWWKLYVSVFRDVTLCLNFGTLFLVQLYYKYESAGKFCRKCQCWFSGQPQQQTWCISWKHQHRSCTESSDRKQTVLTEEKLDAVCARLETAPRKSSKTTCWDKNVLKTFHEGPQNCYICDCKWHL
jgi:hypothetical protein